VGFFATSGILNERGFFAEGFDPDALDYINRVETADGERLEPRVRTAINQFVLGCKQDGIWTSLVTSCIMAGARTVAGAITPLVGNAPTNNNFVAGDYSRTLGLLGNGTNKYLATGYNNNDTTNFPQNNTHISCYVSQIPTTDNAIFVGTRLVALSSILSIRYTGGGANTIFHCRGSQSGFRAFVALGFQCTSRSLSTEFLSRCTHSGGISDLTSTVNSTAPSNNLFGVFAGFNATTPQSFSSARMSFYSIGKSLTIASLDSRVTTLINAIASALA
jgi:hypothetical protein